MLDKYQKSAVEHVFGPCLTIAGPGSGKTKCLVERVAFLIKDRKIPPAGILVITFTKAAAVEMEVRFLKEMPGLDERPSFGTFHSFFFSILREERGFDHRNILDENESASMLSEVLCHLHIPVKEETVEILKKEISYVRNCDISVSDYPSSFGEMFPLIFNGYRAKKQELKKIDFDDMMWEAEKLLQNDRLCQKYRDRYLFMLLDEFQDINPIQFRIVKRILNERKNIFAVGDDDQSIYGFRGSDPKIMLSFTKEFNNAKTVCLRYNYRSSKRVVEAAIKLISNNKNRFFKDIRPYQKGTGAVFCHQFVSDEQEAFFICSRIKKAKENKEKKTVGILYRNHKDARILQYMLQKFKLKEEWLHLHTYHGAKGLEFDEVYLIHVNEGLTPSYSPEDDVEEERRMFYVAITRAKNRLYICCIKNRGGKICHPSRFIHELQS